jgi:hypothetical protein
VRSGSDDGKFRLRADPSGESISGAILAHDKAGVGENPIEVRARLEIHRGEYDSRHGWGRRVGKRRERGEFTLHAILIDCDLHGTKAYPNG